MPRTSRPTTAQRTMAAAVVAGKSLSKAYAIAHPGMDRSPITLSKLASKSVAAKNVQAEIARLMADPLLQPIVLDVCLEAEDPRALRQHAVSIMLRLSRQPEPQVAFAAACWLRDYAEQLEAGRAVGQTREQLLGDLRGLYHKALATAPPPTDTQVEAEVEPVTPTPQA